MTEQDLQWALELSSHVFLCDPDNKDAKNIRTRALLQMAEQQMSAAARNYLLTCLLEDHNAHPCRYPSANTVLALPLDLVFKRMAVSLKAEDVQEKAVSAVFEFTDLEQAFTFHIRNCVLEVSL